MRRSIVSLFILCLFIVPCFGLIGIFPQSALSMADTVESFQEFNRQVVEETSGDIEYIYVSKNSSLDTLNEIILPQNNSSKFSNSISQLDEMSFDDIQALCNSNDYTISEEEDCYAIRNIYSSQRIIAIGEVENNFNATKVISGYEDISILCYDSIEQTKTAYQNLLCDENINVMIDSVVTASDFEVGENTYDYSDFYSWGAEAMDLGYYYQYLLDNGVYTGEVVVAVLDTGINTSHSWFENRILTDSSGKYVGYSYHTTTYTYSGEVFEDDKGHGTHVSGTICELTPSNVKILPIKVLDHEGKGYLSQTVAGIGLIDTIYSETYQIACANMSLGGELETESDVQYHKNSFDAVFNKIREKNILAVVSAGNDQKDTHMFSPAHCEESAIIVSALKQSGNSYVFDTSYSNFGETVDICAPGTSILSAYIGKTNGAAPYAGATSSGTSMASPHVSAAVALLCLDGAYYGGTTSYTADEIESRLFDSAIDFGSSGKDKYYGHGILNLKGHGGRILFDVSDCTVTYDGEYHNITVTPTNVADYDIAYGLTKGNYNITDITTNAIFKNYTGGKMAVYFKLTADHMVDAEGVGFLTINRRDIVVQLEDQTCTYGEVNIDQSKYTITSSDLVQGETLNYTIKTTANNYSNAGKYSLYLDCSSDNYNISHVPATLTIEKRKLSIKLNDQSFTYGDRVVLDKTQYSITSGSVVNNDKLGLKFYTEATNTSDVGEYDLIISDYTNKNYDITTEKAKVKITRRNLVITPMYQSSMYGDEIKVDSSLYLINEGEIVNDDDLGLEFETDAIGERGTYKITLKSYSNENYLIECNEGTYEVTVRRVEISIFDQTFTFGDIISLNLKAYKVTKGSILEGDDLNIELSLNGNLNNGAGQYIISLSYSNDNYDVEVITGNLIVLPRKIFISIPKIILTYGDALSLSDIDYTVTGGEFVGSDQINFIFSTAVNERSDAGEYPIEALSLNKNYIYEVDNDIIKINKRKLVLKSNQTSVYGDEVKLNNRDYQIVDGEIVNNDSLGLKLKTSATSASNVGDYDITANLSNPNYEVSLVESNYTITKRPVRIVLKNQQGTYGDDVTLDNNAFTVASGSIVNNDDLMADLSTNAVSTSGVGYYKITADFNNPNYDVTYEQSEYVVHKREITIRLTDQTVNYSFNIKFDNDKYEVVEGSMLNSDDLDLTLYANVKTFSFIGSYILTGESDNQNYEVTIISGIVNVQFSWISFMLIFVPFVIVTGVGFALYFLRRHHNRNKYLKD